MFGERERERERKRERERGGHTNLCWIPFKFQHERLSPPAFSTWKPSLSPITNSQLCWKNMRQPALGPSPRAVEKLSGNPHLPAWAAPWRRWSRTHGCKNGRCTAKWGAHCGPQQKQWEFLATKGKLLGTFRFLSNGQSSDHA